MSSKPEEGITCLQKGLTGAPAANLCLGSIRTFLGQSAAGVRPAQPTRIVFCFLGAQNKTLPAKRPLEILRVRTYNKIKPMPDAKMIHK